MNEQTADQAVLPTIKKSCSGNCGGNCKKKQLVDSPNPGETGAAAPSKTSCGDSLGLPLLDAPDHVLSTLEKDGSRRWLSPRLAVGQWWNLRRWVAYALIAFFVALPYFRIAGKPPVLLDIVNRKFTFLGHTFLPTDTLLLVLLMLGVFVTVIMTTTVTGRVWCGWGCPQTVYMEFLFRPIDRLFNGTAGKGGKPKQQATGLLAVVRIFVYAVLCSALAHTFLAYFVGTDALAKWLLRPPTEHPVAFSVMIGTTGLMMFDFLFFREQMCLIACPYGRFQSVMLDRDSLIVAYDRQRGEPRKKGKHVEGDGAGSCVDCNRCVDVCPTGIDIRNGLQMECINCTQCIDACDDVMERVGQPKGLIRYSSQNAMESRKQRFLRPRTLIYPVILLGLATAFLIVLSTKYAFDARLLRDQGNPYYKTSSGEMIANRFKLRLTNRTDAERAYKLVPMTPGNLTVRRTGDDELKLAVDQSELFAVTLALPIKEISSGRQGIKLKIVDDVGNERVVTAKILGPSL